MEAIANGLDIPKSVVQVRGVDEAGEVVIAKRLRRSQVAAFFRNRPAAPRVSSAPKPVRRRITGLANCGLWATRRG